MAKPAPADDDPPPTAKRARRRWSGVKTRARKQRARRAVARANPAGWSGMWGVVEDLKAVGAGLGAYGTTRLIQRLASKVAAKRKPTWVRHVNAAAGAVTFAAAILAVRKVKQIAAYEGALVLGTGLAAVQGVVSAYVPRFAWLMNDGGASSLLTPGAGGGAPPAASAGDPDDFLEEQLMAMERTPGQRRARPVTQALQTAAAAAGDQGLEEQLVAELGDDQIDDLYGGVFADPTLFST